MFSEFTIFPDQFLIKMHRYQCIHTKINKAYKWKMKNKKKKANQLYKAIFMENKCQYKSFKSLISFHFPLYFSSPHLFSSLFFFFFTSPELSTPGENSRGIYDRTKLGNRKGQKVRKSKRSECNEGREVK